MATSSSTVSTQAIQNMKQLLKIIGIIWLFFIGSTSLILGQNQLITQWKQGLSGTQLTAYEGRITSNNSTLTVLDLCANGRYKYYKEGSWNLPGQAGGASQNIITGKWEVQASQGQLYLTYATDQGEQGAFPIYLMQNGKVSIGGTPFSAVKGAAKCY